MKKLVFAFSIFLSANSYGQITNYHPLLDTVNRWSFTMNYIVRLAAPTTVPVCNYPFWQEILYTDVDTIINGINYKQLFSDYFSPPYPCLFGFIREDTVSKKTYFQDINNNPEILLYDFSMQIGDSIPLNFYSQYYYQNGFYQLDSITTEITEQGPRAVYNLNCDTCTNSHTLTWIESVGNPVNTIYPYADIQQSAGPFSGCSGYQHQLSQFLICYQHQQKVYFDSCSYAEAVQNSCFNIVDTCNYYNTCGAVAEIFKTSAIWINPNPYHTEAQIIFNDLLFTGSNIYIYDALGRFVYSQKIPQSGSILKRNLLENGLYFFKAEGNQGVYTTGRFVVE